MGKGKSDVPGDGLYERLKFLKRAISDIQIKGMPRIDKGVIAKDDKADVIAKYGGAKHRLLVTGYGLAEVMGTDG
jgi:DNA-directed RNA polymerase III subunit RPC1